MARVEQVKKNDQVLVIAGKNRGPGAGCCGSCRPSGKALVERMNMVKRHTKPNPQKQIQGGILERRRRSGSPTCR